MSKRILLASPRGYCAGVDRAVDAVEKALALYGAPVYVRGEIVHNKYVVARLAEKGAIFVSELEQVPRGARVVFSAHGISPEVRAAAAKRELQPIDATCPLVTKVHREAIRYADAGYDIILVGHSGHEEVEGTLGEAPESIKVVGTPAEADVVTVRDPTKVVWISQTTLSVDETRETVEHLRKRFPKLVDPPSDDICYATQNRQGAVKAIGGRCDLVIVVGSANSSNSVRLVEVAREAGAPDAQRVDSATQLDESWLEGVETIGVTSGASVPEVLVAELIHKLRQYGFEEVEQVRTETETVNFSLPKNLRADLLAAGMLKPRERRPLADHTR